VNDDFPGFGIKGVVRGNLKINSRSKRQNDSHQRIGSTDQAFLNTFKASLEKTVNLEAFSVGNTEALLIPNAENQFWLSAYHDESTETDKTQNGLFMDETGRMRLVYGANTPKTEVILYSALDAEIRNSLKAIVPEATINESLDGLEFTLGEETSYYQASYFVENTGTASAGFSATPFLGGWTLCYASKCQEVSMLSGVYSINAVFEQLESAVQEFLLAFGQSMSEALGAEEFFLEEDTLLVQDPVSKLWYSAYAERPIETSETQDGLFIDDAGIAYLIYGEPKKKVILYPVLASEIVRGLFETYPETQLSRLQETLEISRETGTDRYTASYVIEETDTISESLIETPIPGGLRFCYQTLCQAVYTQ
jgi:hypothetical protein